MQQKVFWLFITYGLVWIVYTHSVTNQSNLASQSKFIATLCYWSSPKYFGKSCFSL